VKRFLVTGGAGFIGCNLVDRLMRDGVHVVVLDDLSRRGTSANLEWLKSRGEFDFIRCDIRDAASVDAAFARYSHLDAIVHLAAQVAVTTSVVDPRADMEINVAGTFNVLEAARRTAGTPAFLYASTNKVYGKLESAAVVEQDERYAFRDLPNGVSEAAPLDFYSPYGCSKGAADQYVRDYSRIYGLKSVVLRQSCIYGPRQFGVEDQGWVAWFAIAHQQGLPITLYGNGKQVRDLLHVEDLVALYLRCVERIDVAAGQIYNVGGGAAHTLSLLETMRMLEDLSGRRPRYAFGDWRPGDQPIFVSDIGKAREQLEWSPRIGVTEGVATMHKWIDKNRAALQQVAAVGQTA
jgi:CDP-paratose 2-epimerase